jgi:hypothetical protein
MLDLKEFNVHMDKVIRTIKSCETHDHLDGARRFAEVMLHYHIVKLWDSKRGQQKQYRALIENSHEVIQKQISLQKCLVKYVK